MEAIIFMVIAAIVGLINNQKKKQVEESQPKPVPSAQKQTEQRPARERTRNFGQQLDRSASELEKEYEKQRSDIENSKPKKVPVDEPSSMFLSREENRLKEELENRKQAAMVVKKLNIENLSIKDGLNQQNLVNGIILSEILGPPRAKKSYAQRMRR
ncbi:hypothetical protein [Jeotgalibacillus soli]|uniref:Uncharacterized protein n=1 Tax=Jeotgalibacillus soli TaxID=889306 RepID=A0A0C2R2E5_9BACL|nr:hypothetical protein [Jeotgalibacillus soli]KIL44450.1 hypothetical protein KP78_34140 [Jeotgalibacillus soli]